MIDVLFYQNYSSVADISTIAICSILGVILISTYSERSRNLQLFKMADILLVVCALSNIIYHSLIENITKSRIVWIYLTRDIYYVGLMVCLATFGIYINNLVDIRGVTKRIVQGCIRLPLILFVLMEVSGPFTHYSFYIDEELQIHQNYYMEPFRLAYVYYVILIVILMIIRRRKFVTKMFWCIIHSTVAAVVVMTIQAIYMQTSYTCITFTFPVMAVLFLFHYNSYDIETGTLDGKAFRSYLNEMQGKKFFMIWLYLEDFNAEKMSDISEYFYHFNEKYFYSPIIFRIRDEKLVMVVDEEKNKYIDAIVPKVLDDFAGLYMHFKMDYKIVLMHSNEQIKNAEEYIELEEFLEEKMGRNTSYQCAEKDMEDFHLRLYISKQLKDIYQKCDLNDERVKVYCQPVLNTETNIFSSAEVLMRIVLPEHGMVFPDQFIPLAERYGYIHALSLIILNKTCQAIKEIDAQGYYLKRVSVNFSMMELRDPKFADDLLQIIRDNGIAFDRVAAELTESRNEQDFELVKSVMTRLRNEGMYFYLDDFGTGYSNFERIIELPINIIKFDKTMTSLAGKNENSRNLIGSFSDIFKRSNYQVLFEGVEDEKDELQCKEMNALYLQGYKYSKPIPIEELYKFLSKN